MNASPPAKLFAGIAAKNPSLFRRVRVTLGDPAAWIEIDGKATALVRDLEMDRVRSLSHADQVLCPADCVPDGGLDPDRETATAQAVAEFFRRQQVRSVSVDRTLPYIFAWHLRDADIEVQYDPEMGVFDRRQKSEEEIDALAEAQAVTESVMQLVCEKIAMAGVGADGTLKIDATDLTSERVRAIAAEQFLFRNYSMAHGAIVASAPQVADCHHSGSGPLRTGVPIVVDLFPTNNVTHYCGDCTRTVVHGQPSDTVIQMHSAVVAAKRAAIEKLRVGFTGQDVHRASESVLIDAGYKSSRGQLTDQPSIQHGTGHGIGLEVHEPILLDEGGGALLEREVFTVEPGLYGRHDGGVRIEDMLVVRDGQAQNLNRLHEGLNWT
ncbi:aminopeptidase P family protein [Roseiconus nitratireducens]|uniref:Aminopeptidase P family protein n=1 Tax=Roseiconus nitratireducens TaxID=2605748 RepID=A0A5M6CTL4_9BACT|nr:M24 family metallopeptidase [Roseiconus nitratireducens]KAA5538554.1 aminopeptidase P family protein [Roseiconus nitratireducens]